MKAHSLLAALLLSGSGLLAQTPGTEPSSEVLQSCLLGTPPTFWTKLKLTPDQLERMRRIQEACEEECDGAGVPVVPNPISNADGETVMSEVRHVLTREQYNAWVAYCTRSGPGGAAPK